MKRTMWCAMLVLAMLISAACGSASPAPAPQVPATLAPTATTEPTTPPPTLVPTKAPPTLAVTATNAPMPDAMLKLVKSTWQWVRSTDDSGKETKVDAPEKYTVQFFLADGKVAVKADCNNAAGSFTADAHNLSISLGPMTLAACPTGSLSDQFVKELGGVQAYLFDGDNLIAGKPDSGSMRFQPAPAVSPSGNVQKLVANPWQWVSSLDNSGQKITVAKPSQYTTQFDFVDGKVAVQADCNNAAGSFTADDHNLSITLGPTTLAACPPGSLSDQFITSLGEVQSYLFDGANLVMEWKLDSGSMRFAKAGTPAAPTTTAKPKTTPATVTPKPSVIATTAAPRPATTLDFKVDLVGCRNEPTQDKPGGLVLVFSFAPSGAAGPYRYFDVDEDKEVTQTYERPASKGAGVIVMWAVQAADGQRLEKKISYPANSFATVGCK
jgi:heat shock protein HslJ